MRKLIVTIICISLTGCATVPQQNVDEQQYRRQQAKELVKTIATIAVIAVIANELGDASHKEKCQNNRAGFYVNNSSGNVYTCP